jgi:hypothetical protein
MNLHGNDAEAAIQETAESWARRHGEKSRPSAEEMVEIERVKTRETAPWLE